MAEKKHFRQLAGIKLCKEGERNTKFFHNVVKIKNSKKKGFTLSKK